MSDQEYSNPLAVIQAIHETGTAVIQCAKDLAEFECDTEIRERLAAGITAAEAALDALPDENSYVGTLTRVAQAAGKAYIGTTHKATSGLC